ncbi:MAG: HYR domain-containing protein, partial [Sphaerobacteraceae bacterium]
GSFELEASLGNLSQNLTLVVASPPELTVPDDVTIPEADAGDYDLSTGASATSWDNEPLDVNCKLQTGEDLEIGDNTIECDTQDSLKQSASDTYVITVASVPTLTVPESFTVDYDQRDPVTWYTSAIDWAGNDIDNVTCDPASGSSFDVGETTVQCDVTDSLGQSASGSFVVTVLPEPEPEIPTINDLRDAIDELDLNRGTENSLMAQLNAAERSLDRGNTNAACGQLGAFINSAGPRIGGDAGADLIEMATQIRDELGC